MFLTMQGFCGYLQIFEGVPWRGGVKWQWGNRKHGFCVLSTLYLQHFRKWDL